MTDKLTLRQLNRTLLHRQLLLQRQPLTVVEAVEQLAGLQAQLPNPPYIGLWTRLTDFARDDLTQALAQKQIVRAALMRSTLHLMTAADFVRYRSAIQPALVRALGAFFGQRGKGLDIAALLAAAQPFCGESPRTTGELRACLLQIAPDADGDALAYAVRAHLPLVQVPPGGTWGSGSGGAYTTPEAWLGQSVDAAENLRDLFHYYLRAFGPASVMDFQFWSGLNKLKDVMQPYTRDLRIYRDPQGKELYDLPHLEIIDGDVPAPARLIPEYDNLIISHADRTRVIADEDRPRIFLSAARVRPTLLVDGFVRGAWRVEKTKKPVTAALIIEPFVRLSAVDKQALTDEGETLIRFIEDRADSWEVRFEDPLD
jgi:hypothetical protein